MTRLHSHIYLHFLGVLVVVGVATAVVFALGARGAFVHQITERVGRHVAALAGEELGDAAALARRLAQLRRDLEFDLTVRDLEGGVVGAAGPVLAGPSAAELAQLRAGVVVHHHAPRWVAAAPIRERGTERVIATVHVAPHREIEWPTLLRPVLGLALVLATVALATAPLARRISRPVARLTEAAQRLGGGDLGYRVPVRGGRPRRWWHRRHDGDELERLTVAFNEMAERVERLVRGEKELLANISHELRSPLARIRVALELVPRHPENTARLRDVENDLVELERLIEDVLATARLEATRLPAHLAPVDATELLHDLAERARHDPATAASVVQVPSMAPLSLVADEALLKRALWNLVENAAKYGAPPVVLDAERVGEMVAIRVTDAGQGIAAEERGRVLAPFYRAPAAPTSAPRPSGAGLGLTLARRVAEVHGGSIAIGPAAVIDGGERGCRVILTLPVTGPLQDNTQPA